MIVSMMAAVTMGSRAKNFESKATMVSPNNVITEVWVNLEPRVSAIIRPAQDTIRPSTGEYTREAMMPVKKTRSIPIELLKNL